MMAEDKKVTSEIKPSQNQGGDEAGDMQDLADELSAAAHQHKGLKTLVLVLGLVLVALFAFVVYAIANRAAESLMSLEDPVAEPPIAEGATPVGDTENAGATGELAGETGHGYHLLRPEGSELMSVSGNARELVFHFRDNRGGDLVILLDRATGRQTQVTVP